MIGESVLFSCWGYRATIPSRLYEAAQTNREYEEIQRRIRECAAFAAQPLAKKFLLVCVRGDLNVKAAAPGFIESLTKILGPPISRDITLPRELLPSYRIPIYRDWASSFLAEAEPIEPEMLLTMDVSSREAADFLDTDACYDRVTIFLEAIAKVAARIGLRL